MDRIGREFKHVVSIHACAVTIYVKDVRVISTLDLYTTSRRVSESSCVDQPSARLGEHFTTSRDERNRASPAMSDSERLIYTPPRCSARRQRTRAW